MITSYTEILFGFILTLVLSAIGYYFFLMNPDEKFGLKQGLKSLVLKQLQKSIPEGIYCYNEKGFCPFWGRDLKKPTQESGYCHYLMLGDWDLEFGLLWDQCKECGIKTEIKEEDLS